VNSHGKRADMLHSLESEIHECNDLLSSLDEVFKCKKTFISGNHEHRLERFIFNKCPELFGITEIEGLLKLESRGYRAIPYGPRQKYQILGSKLFARHEPLSSSAKASAAKALCNLVFGHIHRIEQSYVVGLDGKSHVNFSCGWLGDERSKAFDYCKHNQWQLGFALVRVDEKTKMFYHQIVPILPDFTCVVDGKKYKS
jgi:hypothetical protein